MATVVCTHNSVYPGYSGTSACTSAEHYPGGTLGDPDTEFNYNRDAITGVDSTYHHPSINRDGACCYLFSAKVHQYGSGALDDASTSTGWYGTNFSVGGYILPHTQSLVVNEPSVAGTINFVKMTVTGSVNSVATGARIRPYLVKSSHLYNYGGYNWKNESNGSSLLTTSSASYDWTWANDTDGNPWTTANIAATHWGLALWFLVPGTEVLYVTEMTITVDYTASGGGGAGRMRNRAFPSRFY